MAAITASMVAQLRAKTDAPMMECKKALTEADGNMDKAEELLRPLLPPPHTTQTRRACGASAALKRNTAAPARCIRV